MFSIPLFKAHGMQYLLFFNLIIFCFHFTKFSKSVSLNILDHFSRPFLENEINFFLPIVCTIHNFLAKVFLRYQIRVLNIFSAYRLLQ